LTFHKLELLLSILPLVKCSTG